MQLLKDKHILIGVTGSIAIYKTLELIRLYIKAGAKVRVLMSEEAKRFITPLTFEAISQNQVLHVDTESWANDNNHIEIAKWAECFVIAPISANTVNKLANGIADNLLTQTFLASRCSLVLAPSANTYMITSSITQKSLKALEELGVHICPAQKKLLACNDEGTGAMADVEDIYELTCKQFYKDDFWINKEVIITGGGSIEKIDDVRCLSNFSSGKMADALALAFYLKGANVTLITSKTNPHLAKVIKRVPVTSSEDFYEEIQKNLSKDAYLFMCAAISDYVPKKTQKGKLKKAELGDEWSLDLQKNRDILTCIDTSQIKAIGFKAELDEKTAHKSAADMLEQKNLDAVCLNILGKENSFGSDANKITFITKEKEKEIVLQSKLQVAFSLAEYTKTL